MASTSNGQCCPNDRPTCYISPVVHLFRSEQVAKDVCEPVFGLKDKRIFYLGCFPGVYKDISRNSDRLILKGKPPLDATEAWIVPGNTNRGYVLTRSWELGSVTMYDIDAQKMPTFSMSILDKNSNTLLHKIPGVPQNAQLVQC